MPFLDLPTRRERAAPTFADSEPEELEQYFTDLQALLSRHSITDADQCKRAAIKYVSVTTGRLWKSTAAWADTTQSYADFRSEVFRLYPSTACYARTSRIGVSSYSLYATHYRASGGVYSQLESRLGTFRQS